MGRGSPTSVRNPVPKSRIPDSFSLKGEAFGGNFSPVSYHGSALDTGQGFSLGRSCQPLALRNQWLTDVGGRRRRLAIPESPLREGGADCYHVIARRAKPDAPQGGLSCPFGAIHLLAIPWSMERAENLRDCHAPMGLAMTWRFAGAWHDYRAFFFRARMV